VTERTFLLGPARVFGFGHAGRRTEEESAGEDASEREKFNKPTHDRGWFRIVFGGPGEIRFFEPTKFPATHR
jgi:hypothetical protein